MKICINCGASLVKSQVKFCGHSCAAQVNNAIRGYKNKKRCLCCAKMTSNAKFCSRECIFVYKRSQFDALVFVNGAKDNRNARRRVLHKLQNGACAICTLTTWNNKDIPLEVDHIDGISTNNCLSNLRLLCPNCHAQTSTYKGKNIGNGRYKRRVRYSLGQSY